MEIELENIGKIEHAKVLLDGITVIAGQNNTGKSTVGRALYLFCNSLYHLDDYIEEDLEETLLKALHGPVDNLHVAFMDHTGAVRRHKPGKGDELTGALASYAVHNGTDQLDDALNRFLRAFAALYNVGVHDTFLREPHGVISSLLFEIETTIVETLNVDRLDLGTQKVTRDVLEFFDGDIIRIKKEDNTPSILRVVNDAGLGNELSFVRNKKDGRDFCDDISRKYAVTENALYIESPRALDHLYRLSRGGADMHSALIDLLAPTSLTRSLSAYLNTGVSDDGFTVTEQVQSLVRLSVLEQEISDITGGHLRMNPARGLQFVQDNSDSNRPIKIWNLSNGIKSLMLLEYSLECGCLKEGDILILDEPEINLHPEWQIQYASILIRLQKSLNLKILITTHTPFFLEAIETASEIGDIKERCHYYQAKEVDPLTSRLEEVTGQTRKIYDELAEPFQELEDIQNRAAEEN